MRKFLSSFLVVLILTSFSGIKKGPQLPKEFELIPAGNFWPDSTRQVSMESFFISKYEVSNKQYREFFNEVSLHLNEAEKAKIAFDSTAWEKVLSNSKAIKAFYHSHENFNDYPVVNISHYGAQKYCEWLQQKIQKENPDYTIEVTLPTKEEYVWAARGGRRQAMFPWGNYYLRNKKGDAMCNFKMVPDQNIYRNRETGKPEIALRTDRVILTSEIKSYVPNGYGLYNMCGNAAEMIAENGIAMGGSWNDYGGDIHIKAETAYENASPTVGFRPVVKANSLP